MSNRQSKLFDAKKRDKFLSEVEESGGNISHACRACKVGRRTVYALRDKDEEFAKQLEHAVRVGDDVLEDEARRRAFSGVKKAVYYKGKVVGHELEYSDMILKLMLQSRKRDVYGAKAEVTLNQDFKSMSDDELLDVVRQKAAKLGVNVEDFMAGLQGGDNADAT